MTNRVIQYRGDGHELLKPQASAARPQNLADLSQKLDAIENHLADTSLSEELRERFIAVRQELLMIVQEIRNEFLEMTDTASHSNRY